MTAEEQTKRYLLWANATGNWQAAEFIADKQKIINDPQFYLILAKRKARND